MYRASIFCGDIFGLWEAEDIVTHKTFWSGIGNIEEVLERRGTHDELLLDTISEKILLLRKIRKRRERMKARLKYFNQVFFLRIFWNNPSLLHIRETREWYIGFLGDTHITIGEYERILGTSKGGIDETIDI